MNNVEYEKFEDDLAKAHFFHGINPGKNVPFPKWEDQPEFIRVVHVEKVRVILAEIAKLGWKLEKC